MPQESFPMKIIHNINSSMNNLFVPESKTSKSILFSEKGTLQGADRFGGLPPGLPTPGTQFLGKRSRAIGLGGWG